MLIQARRLMYLSFPFSRFSILWSLKIVLYLVPSPVQTSGVKFGGVKGDRQHNAGQIALARHYK